MSIENPPASHDLAALEAAAAAGGAMALCTLVGLEGSFSRRLGAQIAVGPDGSTVGSLSDGCLERQLAADALAARAEGRARVERYGAGSPMIDFRLPCGGGLDILIDPFPDPVALQAAATAIAARQEAAIDLPLPEDAPATLLRRRFYQPPLRTLLFGEGPEPVAFATLARAMGTQVEAFARAAAGVSGLALGQVPPDLTVDRWTAILLLFHDHEWERALVRWALGTPAFYIGAQGGAVAREGRADDLLRDGHAPEEVARVKSPIGLIARARDPQVLALSVLAEIVAEHERLHPHR